MCVCMRLLHVFMRAHISCAHVYTLVSCVCVYMYTYFVYVCVCVCMYVCMLYLHVSRVHVTCMHDLYVNMYLLVFRAYALLQMFLNTQPVQTHAQCGTHVCIHASKQVYMYAHTCTVYPYVLIHARVSGGYLRGSHTQCLFLRQHKSHALSLPEGNSVKIPTSREPK